MAAAQARCRRRPRTGDADNATGGEVLALSMAGSTRRRRCSQVGLGKPACGFEGSDVPADPQDDVVVGEACARAARRVAALEPPAAPWLLVLLLSVGADLLNRRCIPATNPQLLAQRPAAGNRRKPCHRLRLTGVDGDVYRPGKSNSAVRSTRRCRWRRVLQPMASASTFALTQLSIAAAAPRRRPGKRQPGHSSARAETPSVETTVPGGSPGRRFRYLPRSGRLRSTATTILSSRSSLMRRATDFAGREVTSAPTSPSRIVAASATANRIAWKGS